MRETSRRLQEVAQRCSVWAATSSGITDQVPLSASAELLATRTRVTFQHAIEVDGHRCDLAKVLVVSECLLSFAAISSADAKGCIKVRS